MPSLFALLLSATTLFLVARNSVEYAEPMHGGVRFEPSTLIVDRDSSGYVQSMVRLYSAHGDSIRITNVSGSCSCASASVQRPLMADTTPAKVFVQINAKHFKDSINTVLYTVRHTGSTTPSVFTVIVRCKQ